MPFQVPLGEHPDGDPFNEPADPGPIWLQKLEQKAVS